MHHDVLAICNVAPLTASPGGPVCKMPLVSRPSIKGNIKLLSLAPTCWRSQPAASSAPGSRPASRCHVLVTRRVPHQQVRDDALEARVVVAQPGRLAQQRHGPRLRACPRAHASGAGTACASAARLATVCHALSAAAFDAPAPSPAVGQCHPTAACSVCRQCHRMHLTHSSSRALAV